MFIFINPWASYDPDDIPSLYSGDPEIDKQVMWAVIYSIVISCIYLVGSIYLLNDILFDYIHKHFYIHVFGIFGCIGTYIALLIFGINKIMK